jgi:hypothetical protein
MAQCHDFAFRLASEVQATIESAKREMDWEPRRRTLGIHLRRGDVVARKIFPLDAYLTQADRICERYDIDTIYLSTESQEEIEHAKELRPQYRWLALPHDRAIFPKQSETDRFIETRALEDPSVIEPIVESALADLYFLQHCDAFLGTFSSEFSLLAWLLCIGHKGCVVPYVNLVPVRGLRKSGSLSYFGDYPFAIDFHRLRRFKQRLATARETVRGRSLPEWPSLLRSRWNNRGDRRDGSRGGRSLRLARSMSAAVGVLADLRAHLRDESHHGRESTYVALRRAYVLSHGVSTRLLSSLIRQRRHAASRAGSGFDDVLSIEPEVRANGFAVRTGFVAPHAVAEMISYFSTQPGDAIGDEPRFTRYERVADVARGLKFEYARDVTLGAPHVLEVLTSEPLLAAARRYLGSEPIFAGVKAWWSLLDLAASDAERSAAAQQYHFDYDYPAFMKFFVYLTDVGPNDGPLMYIEGTHRRKPRWVDGRRTDDELLHDLRLLERERTLTGPAGTLIAADTSGYHKGAPVRARPRLILEVEYAVSRLGSSCFVEDYPADMRPASAFPHTFDLFCAPTRRPPVRHDFSEG